jgi:hypothetical protein
MKAKRKIPYLILLVAVIVSLAGYSALSSGAAPAGEAGEDARDRLAGAVVVYAGSMYSLVDNELRVIDPENELITPFVEGSRVLVPLRFIAESFGAAPLRSRWSRRGRPGPPSSSWEARPSG